MVSNPLMPDTDFGNDDLPDLYDRLDELREQAKSGWLTILASKDIL